MKDFFKNLFLFFTPDWHTDKDFLEDLKDQSDYDAIKGDWETIGDDLRTAMGQKRQFDGNLPYKRYIDKVRKRWQDD